MCFSRHQFSLVQDFPMADSSANASNGSSSLVVILLVLNLLVGIAMLAHVVYYTPQNAGGGTDSSETQTVADLQIDGVGNIGMGANGIELEMIELNQNNPTGAPRVMQTVTMSQEAFLNTLGRMSLLRERLIEKEMVKEVE